MHLGLVPILYNICADCILLTVDIVTYPLLNIRQILKQILIKLSQAAISFIRFTSNPLKINSTILNITFFLTVKKNINYHFYHPIKSIDTFLINISCFNHPFKVKLKYNLI